MFLIFW